MISSFLKRLGQGSGPARQEAVADHYKAEELKNPDKESLSRVRSTVLASGTAHWKEEDPFSPLFFDEFEGESRHFVCKDTKTGKPVACGRLTSAGKFQRSPVWQKEFHMDAFQPDQLPQVLVMSKWMVQEDLRKKLPAIVLAMKLYEAMLEPPAAQVCLASTDLNDYNFLRFLGFRPMARISHSAFGGYRIPVFLIPHDYPRLKASESPFYDIAEARECPQEGGGMEWMKRFHAHQGRIDTGFMTFDRQLTRNYEPPVLKGLSDKGREEMMAKAAYLKCGPGESVLREGQGGGEMGFVMRGALEVRKGEKVIAVLSETDIFGEIAAVLGSPRSADVTGAVPGTEIILLRIEAVRNLSSRNDESVFWKNLSEVLLTRLMAACRLSGEGAEEEILRRLAAETGIVNPEAAVSAAADSKHIMKVISENRENEGPEASAESWKEVSKSLAGHLIQINNLTDNPPHDPGS